MKKICFVFICFIVLATTNVIGSSINENKFNSIKNDLPIKNSYDLSRKERNILTFLSLVLLVLLLNDLIKKAKAYRR